MSPSPRTKRWLGRAFRLAMLAAGVGLLVAVLRHTDLEALWDRIRGVGWMFAAAFGAFVCTEITSTLGWRELVRAEGHDVPFAALLAAFWSGEAVNYLLPAGAFGEVMKGLFLRRHAPRGDLLESVALFNLVVGMVVFLWVIVGALLALAVLDVPPLVPALSAAIAAGLLVVLVVVRLLVRRDKLGRWLAALSRLPLVRLDRERIEAHVESMDDKLSALWRGDRRRFARLLGWLLLARVTTVIEVYILLVALLPERSPAWLLGLALLAQVATRMVAYMTLFVPGQIGTVEAGAAFVFAHVGLGGATGLAMELLRRARKLLAIAVAGVFGLVAKSRDALAELR